MAFEASKMTLAIASERSIFRKNHDYNSYNYKRAFRVAVNTYVSLPIFRGLDARGGRKLRTDTCGTTTVTIIMKSTKVQTLGGI